LIIIILRWIIEVLGRVRAIRAPFPPRIPAIVPWLDLVFLVGALIAVAYSSYALYRQYRFFERWERRIGLLQHLEKQLIEEQLGEKS
ncbi:MAG: hypothetical protein ACE5KH_01935, partial [Candidatus Geothermarchaeales archaeon]